jgi:hypothetical protein
MTDMTVVRGSIGDNAVLGDPRWAGAYGVDADYVADQNCKICVFLTEDIRVAAPGLLTSSTLFSTNL